MLTFLYAAALLVSPGMSPAPAPSQFTLRAFTVTASQCEFVPARLDVDLGDRVRITFTALDGPHSFVIDEFRIARRATPDRGVTFEFLADRVGTFAYVSNLVSDAACPNMRGELVVHRPIDRP